MTMLDTSSAPAWRDAPVPTPSAVRHKSDPAASLTLGVAAALAAWIPFVGVVLGVLAIFFALRALVNRLSTAKAVTGLALGIVGFVASALVTFTGIFMVWHFETYSQLAERFSPTAVGQDDRAVQDTGPLPDRAEFTALDDETFAPIVADPTAAFGDRHVIFGEVQYVEDCTALIYIDDAQQATWEAYEVPAWVTGRSSDGSCPEFADVAELTHVQLWVTVHGKSTTEWDDGTVEDVLELEVAHLEELEPLP